MEDHSPYMEAPSPLCSLSSPGVHQPVGRGDEYSETPGILQEAIRPPPYQCNMCEKTFSVPARLLRHHRIHTGEKPYKCEYCEKTFSVKENLNVHRRVHTKERPYKCTLCNRAFEHSGKLHRHMRTHTGERPHKCEICAKTFVQSGQLVIHMRAHTGEKPYTCEHCQKGFTCSKQLKVHIRTHTGEKPYECDVCGKTFGYNHVLKMHKMSHLGEKMYKCTLCDRFFGSRKALDKHIKEHNKEPLRVPEHLPPPLITDDGTDSSRKDYNNCLLYDQDISYGLYSYEATSISKLSKRHGTDFQPYYSPLTPPRSPVEDGLRNNHLLESTAPVMSRAFNPDDERSTHFLQTLRKYYSDLEREVPSGDVRHPHRQMVPRLAFFTTENGERLACPADLILRLQGPTEHEGIETGGDSSVESEKDRLQKELKERLKKEEMEEKERREKAFCNSVVRVLESCIGSERLSRLGYPDITIDKVIMNTLKLMGTRPCWEPSLSQVDRIKVNLRLLLECCVPDQELWLKFGWKGKAIEDIIYEFLQKSNDEPLNETSSYSHIV